MAVQPISCIYCGQSDQNVPLLLFQYQGKQYWICPQHLPILIHKPVQLADKLPGLELITPFGDHS
jgi:hypothetical protein